MLGHTINMLNTIRVTTGYTRVTKVFYTEVNITASDVSRDYNRLNSRKHITI